MLNVFDPFRTLSFTTLLLRMVLAFFCGGVIGIERELKRRPAGFRTHILICMGAAMTTIVSQYLYLEMHYQTDMARIGAQVIAGIGFIGAGTIIVSRRQRIKGLTTAAGLWATAIVGLSLGSGFYESGIITVILILTVELVMSKVERFVLKNTPELNVYVECKDRYSLERIVDTLSERKVRVVNMEVMRAETGDSISISVIFLLRLPKNVLASDVIFMINSIDGVTTAEEL